MKLFTLLESGRVLVGDGAMGTLLNRPDVPPERCPELHTINRPDLITGIHRRYIDAGADWIQTNTFGASKPRLAENGVSESTTTINRKAAELATGAAGGRVAVAGSMGPCGLILEPYGTASRSTVEDVFTEQSLALAEGGVDFIIVETMMDLNEATAAVESARRSTDLPVVATMTFERGEDGFFTMWGTSTSEAIRALTDAGAVAIGANCGCGFQDMTDIAADFLASASIPVITQSNAGMPILTGGESTYTETPESIKPAVSRMLELGVRMIGGCCGTSPDHIRNIRNWVSDYQD